MFVSALRMDILALAADGLSTPQIARRLGLALPTVAYHLSRAVPVARGDAGTPLPVPDVASVQTRERVAELLAEGHAKAEVARRLGIAKSTVAYHARRLGRPVDERCCRRYDWSAVQRYYDSGRSVRDCQERFGFSRQTWQAAVARGAIVPRPSALPLDKLLVAGTYRSRHNLTLRLRKAGVKERLCERCGLAEWRGAPLSLALHHVNGNRDDNRLENLELLCPNATARRPTSPDAPVPASLSSPRRLRRTRGPPGDSIAQAAACSAQSRYRRA